MFILSHTYQVCSHIFEYTLLRLQTISFSKTAQYFPTLAESHRASSSSSPLGRLPPFFRSLPYIPPSFVTSDTKYFTIQSRSSISLLDGHYSTNRRKHQCFSEHTTFPGKISNSQQLRTHPSSDFTNPSATFSGSALLQIPQLFFQSIFHIHNIAQWLSKYPKVPRNPWVSRKTLRVSPAEILRNPEVSRTSIVCFFPSFHRANVRRGVICTLICAAAAVPLMKRCIELSCKKVWLADTSERGNRRPF